MNNTSKYAVIYLYIRYNVSDFYNLRILQIVELKVVFVIAN
jgi:hypothetical protein